MVQCLGLGTLTAKGPGSVPDQGTKIPQAMQYAQKNKQNKTQKKTNGRVALSCF